MILFRFERVGLVLALLLLSLSSMASDAAGASNITEKFTHISPRPAQVAKTLDYLSKEHVNIPNVDFLPPGVSWDTFHRNGTIHGGHISTSLKTKLLLEESLQVIVIGGSVSCGSKLPMSTKHLIRYGNIFQEMLNAVMKPKNRLNRHSVVLHCESGATTEEWAERITSGQITRKPSLADIVLIDTSVNDIVEVENGFHTQRKFQEQMELILYALQSFPDLNIVVLGTSTRHGPWRGEIPRGDSLLSFADLCDKEEVTLLSVIDGLGPLTSKDAQLWWLYEFTSGGWRAAETKKLKITLEKGPEKRDQLY